MTAASPEINDSVDVAEDGAAPPDRGLDWPPSLADQGDGFHRRGRTTRRVISSIGLGARRARVGGAQGRGPAGLAGGHGELELGLEAAAVEQAGMGPPRIVSSRMG